MKGLILKVIVSHLLGIIKILDKHIGYLFHSGVYARLKLFILDTLLDFLPINNSTRYTVSIRKTRL